MFTDGKTTAGAPPAPVAAAARAAGIVIYCIGLIGADGIDVDALNDWATDPDASHVAVTPDESDLEQLFADLAKNISKPGATNIVIDEIVNSDFTITSITPPNRGTAVMINSQTIRWTIQELGVTGNEGASLEFFIQHTAQTSGMKLVNESITYTDTEGNAVTFPAPVVTVDCGIVVNPEPCPIPVDFKIDSCKDSIVVDLGDVALESLGRIAQLDVTVKNICPNKRGSCFDRSGFQWCGIPERAESHYNSRASLLHLPGCFGKMHQICTARGSGCIGWSAKCIVQCQKL